MIIDILKWNNYALVDLAIGIALILVLLFPNEMSVFVDVFVDLRLTVLLGLLFLILISARGLVGIAVFLMLEILKMVCKIVGLGFAVRIVEYLERALFAFLLSCIEGMALFTVIAIVLLPFLLPFPGIIESLYESNKLTFAPLTAEFLKLPVISLDEDGALGIILISIVIAAFSSFALFLLKTKDIAIARSFNDWRIQERIAFCKREGDDQRVRGLEATREFVRKIYKEMKEGHAQGPLVP